MRQKLTYKILLIASVLLYVGCMERVDVDLSPSEYITFKATLGDSTKVRTRSITDNFEITEEEWPLDMTSECEQTKATLNNILGNYRIVDGKGGAGVFGYIYSSKDETPHEILWNDMNNCQYDFDGDEMFTTNTLRWSLLPNNLGDKLKIYAYAPRISTEGQSKVINIEDVENSQTDYIVAVSEPIDVVTESVRGSVNLGFEHIFTAVKVELGGDLTDAQYVTVSGIRTSGSYTLGGKWGRYESNDNMELEDDQSITFSIGDTFFMIPQELGDNAKLTITLNNSEKYSVSLKNKEWRQGKLITYTLNKKQSDDSEYIYFDIAAGPVTINETTYSGKVFVAGYTEAQVISGKHESGNKYYVYQSCVTNVNKDKGNYNVGYSEYDSTKEKGIGTPKLPSYADVTWQGMRWRDFITNNKDVESVIEAWDNAAGAGKGSSGTPNGAGAAGAVRNAGREATKNIITVTDDVNECLLVLDNIYISAQYQGGHNRTWGGITYTPTAASGSKLTLNIIGDNRVGCVYYNNSTKAESVAAQNELIFEGSGSITVADTDYYESGGGYFSNHYDSAIGNCDKGNGCYGIIINSGIIYSGTTQAENCTAIGGGGNGFGEVIINGGVVTAVASTTGTAIGGGIGFSSEGGGGYVEINGGNVYAYNKDNGHSIPSSAIGGAGSQQEWGSKGTVIINDGYVYAYSALGTAIGGGSSYTKKGGDAEVIITGGNVIAMSGAPGSAGIGGGTTGTGGDRYWKGDSDTNGGNAIITIGSESNLNSTMPILRTGSIGGGGSGHSSGNIGNANITIYGGDIQAQFVMAASDNNVFNMQGGLIRNSDTSDDEYKCIQENGGAVYMQQGTFTMSGGTIKKCSASKTSASKGGAVYIEGGSFTMTGGTIEQCTSNSHGGALYIEGGDVVLNSTVSEVLFSGNVTKNGNGGAICINGGTFKMDGENVNISNNAAIDREHLGIGNGGGVYVSSASGNMTVELTKGSITGNAAGRNGGGVCVINGGEGLTVNVSNIINDNNTLLEGGGLYVSGDNARVNINDGSVKNNTTSGYQKNQQIKVDVGGLVTLNKADVTDQITVTFNDNASYYGKTIEGNVATDTETYQYLVRSNRGILSDVTPTKEGYTFSEWNTRRDGKGDTYTNTGEEVILDQDIILYAIWNKN